jgi:hypothetical protein
MAPSLHASRLLYNGHGFTDDGLRLHSPRLKLGHHRDMETDEQAGLGMS